MRYKVLITRPIMVNDDATAHTYHWAKPILKECYLLGYDVKDLAKKDAEYKLLSKTLMEYNPHVYIHFGHGCVANLVGHKACILTNGSQNVSDNNKYFKNYKYRLDDDIMCDLLCSLPSNIHLVKNKIVIAYACHSAKRLGICAMRNGALAYIGFDDYLIFITDNKGSEKLFTDPILEFSKSLINGDTIKVAKERTLDKFDENIRRYKSYKMLAMLLLWDKKAFTVYTKSDNLTIFG